MIQNSELIEWLKKKAETVTMPGARKMYQAAVKALEAQKDMVSLKTANVAIRNACGKIDCDKMDKCEKLQLPPANCSEFPNNSDTISRQAAIEKLKAHRQDDKIEVGDEVNWLGDCFIVTRIFQPHNMKEQCDGIDDDGCVYHAILMDDLEKTGRHFDIASILKEMRT